MQFLLFFFNPPRQTFKVGFSLKLLPLLPVVVVVDGTSQCAAPDPQVTNSSEVEVFIYMRLSLLHSASATIAPAGSPWTNDSERALNTEEDVVSARRI